MDDVSTSIFQIGAGALRFTPPNLVELDIVAPFEGAHAGRILELLQEIRTQHGLSHVLVDVSRLDHLPRDVRENVIDGQKFDAILAMAVVGTGFALRVAITMILKAARVLTPRPYTYPFEFFDDKAQALVWLKAQPNPTPS
jgi:hypothetical protein